MNSPMNTGRNKAREQTKMTQQNDFLIKDLFEKAKTDPSWEENEEKRIKMADGLLRSIMNSLS